MFTSETEKQASRVRVGHVFVARNGYWLRLKIHGFYASEEFGNDTEGTIVETPFDTMNLSTDGGWPRATSLESYACVAFWSYLRKNDPGLWRQIRKDDRFAVPVVTWDYVGDASPDNH